MKKDQMNLMDRIEIFLQSSTGLFLALIMVLAFSTPNTTEVLTKINRIPYIEVENVRLLALSFAIVIEFIILILAAIGQEKAAKYYAIASFIFHCLYYHRWDEILIADYYNKLQASEVITNFIASILTSFMISASIHYFSKQIKVKIEEKRALKEIGDKIQENANLLKENAELVQRKAELEIVIKEAENMIALNNSINAELEKVIAQEKQNKALIQKDLNDMKEEIEQCQERIRIIKKIKAALSRGAMNDEIKMLLDQINPDLSEV